MAPRAGGGARRRHPGTNARRAWAALALALCAGCEDLPLEPRVVGLGAGQESWIAVTLPVGVPAPRPTGAGMPDGRALERALAGLEEWSARVRGAVPPRGASGLRAELGAIDGLRLRARTALGRGDTARAVVLLTRAARRVYRASPASVAPAVLAEAEARVAATDPATDAGRRARRLLWSAHARLRQGDAERALLSAIYALQVAGGAAVVGDESREP